ncbi:MAG: OmpA family protein [Endomicrobia bacterium]|nr:OmpA family protein [Endomicrobiia bacterium]
MFIKDLRFKAFLLAVAAFVFVKVDYTHAYDVYDFNDLSNAVSAATTTITFATTSVNYTAILSSINYAGPIDIYGNGVTLDGAGLYRIFAFENTNVAFHDDINFVGGFFNGNGGAIYNINNSSIAFVDANVVFDGNIAVSSGGAVFNEQSYISFTGSTVTFSSNTATRSGSVGGAMYNASNSSVLFTTSTVIFSSNVAGVGGAIYNDSNSTITFADGDITFAGNIASFFDYKYGGGAIYNGSNSNISFTSSTVIFSSNTAGFGSGGGAISNRYSNILFTSSTVIFSSNTAHYGGGAILNQDHATMTFTSGDITFAGNIGAAISNRDNSNISFTSSTVMFSSNMGSADFNGAISNYDHATMTFTSSDITFAGNNTLDNGGGAISNGFNSNILFTSSTVIFSGNTTIYYYGGAIYNNYIANISFTGSSVTFIGNTAGRGGGAIYNSNDSTISFTSSAVIFSNNDGWNGGAISNIGVWWNSTAMSFTASTVTFSNNDGWNGGAIYNSDNSNISFTSSTVIFSSNTSAELGGAIFNEQKSEMEFANSDIKFIDNTSGKNGGAIYSSDDATIIFTNSNVIFAGNTASFDGGAIFNSASTMTFTNGDITFSENEANYGGAIYGDNGSLINFEMSSGDTLIFENNEAAYFGGAIYGEDSIMTFTNGDMKFTGNSAYLGSGGAIFSKNGLVDFKMSSGDTVIFENNTSKAGGGAIYGYGAQINFETVLGNTIIFDSNTSQWYGGAIYNEYSTMTFTNGNIMFSGNSAEEDSGGAIFNGSAQINFEMSSGDTVIFDGNTAQWYGGAIYNWNNSTAAFANGDITFSSNTAQYGGAVSNWYDSEIDFMPSSLLSFINNSATNQGGAIFNYDHAAMAFTSGDIMFIGNSAASYGGAIVNYDNAEMTFTGVNVMFSGNSAGSDGGAIYNGLNSRINFNMASGSSVTFTGNTAAFGRDIYNASGGTINITGAGNIIFSGGIEGDGDINKTGTGKVHFEAGSKTDIGGSFNLAGGNVYFSTSAKISSMEIGAASLTLDVDFIGSLTSVLYFDDITINMADSKLYVNNISTGALVGLYSRAIFYSNSANNGTFDDSRIYDAVNENGSYNLVWQTGSYDYGYSYMGLLMLDSMGPWNQFVAAYKAVTAGNTIYLDQNIIATTNDENPFGFPDFTNITIAGYNGGVYIIDSNGRADKGLTIASTQTINIENLTFQNFNKTGNGGVILSSGGINIGGNVSFINNTASGNGGGICNYNSTTTFANGNIIFAGNSATGSFLGGAIYSGNNSLIDFNMVSGNSITFSENTSGSEGGAILNTASKMTFANADIMFTGNSATRLGGAILNYYMSTMTFTNGNITFDGNSAQQIGGAINNTSFAEMSFTTAGLMFSGNKAGTGGAIYNYSRSKMTFTDGDVTFIGNSAENYDGGAIFNTNNSIMTFANADITFTSNTANSMGGAILNGDNAMITVTGGNAAFTGNASGGSGGAIYNYTDGLIDFNAPSGGNIIFSGNTSGNHGGAIYNEAAGINFDGKATFAGNTGYASGAICNYRNSAITFANGDIMFSSNTALNTATSYGGAIYNSSSLISFDAGSGNSATFAGNTAKNGGAIFNYLGSVMEFKSGSVVFNKNTAFAGVAGAIYNYSGKINFEMSSGDAISFTGNTADTNGGAIYGYNNSIMTFTGGNVTFIGNGASSNSGGAIYVNSNSEIIFTTANVIFSANKANTSGGAIFNTTSSSISFTGSAATFNGNIAQQLGGAIYNFNSGNINFTGVTAAFAGNTADTGGAIYNGANSSVIMEGEGTFTGNKAVNGNGGAIYNAGLLELSAASGKSILFTGNSAGGQGNDIYNTVQGTIMITGSGTVTINDGISGLGLIEKSAGIFNVNGNSSGYTGVFSQTGGNTVVTSNTFAGAHNISSGSEFELATGAAMSAGSNYALSSATMTISAGNNLAFGGQIIGTGLIDKTGTGKMHFTSGADIDFGGRFNLAGGNVHFSTFAKISSMEVGAAGALTLDVDFIGSRTSILYFDDITINTANSVLYVNNTSTGALDARVYSRAIFYSNTQNDGTFDDNNIYDVATGSSIYNLVWQSGLYDYGYTWMGLLTLDMLGPWNKFVAAYKAVTTGNTIYLDQNITAVTNDEDPFDFPNYTDITIAGYNGDVYIIDSNGRFNKGLTIASTHTINIENLTFQNFNTSGAGGVINNNGIVNMGGEVSFINNTAVGSGGAIYSWNNSTMTFVNADAMFIGNNAASLGGAVYNAVNSEITFTNGEVMFDGNVAVRSGGAVYNRDNSHIDFASTVVNFINNGAGISGGAIYNTVNSTMTFTNGEVTFDDNVAVSSGGAVYNRDNSHIDFASTIVNFINNGAGISGGAIYNTANSTMTFTNSEVTFDDNVAVSSGGAVYNRNNSLIDFASTIVNFINNSAGASGGAIYSEGGANTSFCGGTVIFEGNKAVGKGGALYIADSAITFDTDGGSVTFRDNMADGKANDVYMDINAKLGISGSNDIRFESGILSEASGSGIEINKYGTGKIYLGGENEVWGDFNINGGDIIMLASATYKGKALELGSASSLDMHNKTVNTVEIAGDFRIADDMNLKMDIFSNGKNDIIKSSGTAYIGGSNIYIYAGIGTYTAEEYNLIITNSSSTLDGVFASSTIIVLGKSYLNDYQLRYIDGIVKLMLDGSILTNFRSLEPLTYNQSETARAFDIISEQPGNWETIFNEMMIKLDNGTDKDIAEIKDFLARTSGYFLSNVIRNIAADSPNNEVYDKIRNHREEHETNSGLWVQLKGGMESFYKDENSLEDYGNISMGVMFGYDRYIKRDSGGDMMYGIYARINKDNIEQGEHKADGNKNGLGIYGGYLRNGWELKGMLLGSYDKFNTERMTYAGDVAKADINAVTVSADMELGINICLGKVITMRPYGGIEAANTMYGAFKEKGAGQYNLDVREGNYLRSAARVGLGLGYEKGKWIWYANAEGKYKIDGTKYEIESEFEDTGVNFYSRSSEEGNIEIGAGLGGEVRIAKNWKGFINAKYYAGERYENAYGNIGIRYLFGGKKIEDIKEAVEAEDNADEKAALEAAEEAKKIAAAAAAAATATAEKAKKQAEIDADNEAAMEQARKEAKARREKPVLKSFSMDMANFAIGSANLSARAKENIALQAKEIKQFEYKNMTIEGHTDSTGSVGLNKRLSTQRAKAVYDEFVKNGIPEEKLTYIGFGLSMPKASNKTAAGRAQNRRVEIFVE